MTDTIQLPGYEIAQKIYDGTRTIVYGGTRKSDSQPVAIKILRNQYPTFTELVQFRNQYTIADNLDLPGIVRPLELLQFQNRYALVMSQDGSISLAAYSEGEPLSLDQFFPIALQLAETLHGLHQNRVIHKDIKPANVLIHPETLQVTLIDFSISSLLPRETEEIQNPNVLEGTLAYISPEQTGRMNRGIDYRTDFYSLGVTFYELLVGERPFTNEEPMELLHSHIATMPTALGNRTEEIPGVLSDIVLKLMAKNAEDRYQSARGLKHDLERCFEEWQQRRTIASFELGQQDKSDRFVIPEKLYGRETEVRALLNAFDKIANPSHTPHASHTPQIMLVAGFSGIGKTAIVREVHKPIVRARGYFISGKFEQFQRNIPFSALVQAFRDLIQQLLTESEERIDRFRVELLAVLGKDGRVIIDVIPEVELLIGSQPPVPKLEGTAAQNRFNLLFSKFVRVFTAAERPLVIFLDDLQWADSASLKLIQLLVGQTESAKQGGLLLIGAYRDNEVGAGHPLMLALEEIRQQGDRAPVSQITLGPLNLHSLNQLVADTLNCSPELALPLTQLVGEKTQGNPFFATQFLKSLYEDGLISFVWAEGTEGGYWQCDIAKVRGLAISDDVVEFMARQLRRLSDRALEVLKIAACIGNQFDLATLAIACNKSPEATAAALWKPLQEGLILPGSKIYKFFQGEIGDRDPFNSYSFTGEKLPSISYKFLHDRVQQAAYFLIPEAEKKSTHLKIGQLLLTHASSEELEEQIFAIVNQLNLGRELIADSQKLEELSRLNLQAGRKALESTAHAAAKEYLNIGLELLPQNCWQTQYELTLELHDLAATAAYLNGDFDRAQTLIAIVIERGQNVLDKISVYETKIQLFAAQNQMQAAVDAGLEILDILGVDWVEEPPPNLSNAELYNLPKMTDPEKEAALRILTNIQAPLYHANPQRMGALAFTMVHLCIEYGNCSLAPYAYCFYGFIRCVGMSDFEGGNQLGKLSLQMLDKFDCRDIQAKVVNLFNCFIRHWKEHTRETITPLKDNVRTALENGDLEYTAYATFNYCHNSVLIGANLDTLSQECKHYLALLRQIKQEFQLEATQVWGELVLNLKGEAANNFEEASLLEKPRGNPMSLYGAYHAKSYLAYLFEDYENAVAFCAEAEKYEGAMASLLPVTQNPFYYALSLLAKVPTPDLDRFLEAAEELAFNEELTEVFAKVNYYQEKMKMWADNAPMNFQHKYDLVEAEKRRVLGKTAEAIAYYERAIAGAKSNGYIQEEALANELAAKFYLAWNKNKVAQGYFIDAYYCYSRWGAKAKVRDLEQKYRQYLTPILERETVGLSLEQTISKMTDGTVTSIGGTTKIANLLNLSTVIKAARSLSEEIELDSLLTKLMQVMMENAGAQSGLLLLRESKKWLLAARCEERESCQILLSPIVIGSSAPVGNVDGLDYLPQGAIDYVSRARKTLVLDNASAEKMFESEPYTVKYQPRSVLCMPLIDRGKLIAILYLENNQLAGAFTKDRLEIIEMLSSQAVISIENARLYQKAQQALEELKVAQLQLVQSEKMSALGNLVAGVAHEINNPVGFISGNLEYARDYLQDLFDLISLYEAKYPSPEAEIQEKMADIELDYLREDFLQLLASLQEGANTLQHISKSLRTFSRGDKDRKVDFDLHEGIESSLLILKHRLKAKENRPQIKVIKNYAELPKIKCFPGQLNQVFMNLLANAIDALDEDAATKPGLKEIAIKTQMESDRLKISIADNGIGMSVEVKKRIFEQGFTTKAVGKGTGLGMAIACQIVEDKHGGKITCTSEVGKGTEFVIFLPLS